MCIVTVSMYYYIIGRCGRDEKKTKEHAEPNAKKNIYIFSMPCFPDDKVLSAENWLFHQKALQEYLLVCCQYPGGGLIDKPGR